eukprot:scaffold2600_cov238-Pinguiococcus_pyrenoidosus.AAC.8
MLPLVQKVVDVGRRVAQERVDVPSKVNCEGRHEQQHEGCCYDNTGRVRIGLRGAALEAVFVEEAAILVAVQLTFILFADLLPEVLIVAEVLVVGVDHLIHDRGHEESRVNGGSEVQDSNESRGRIAFMEAQRIEGVVP